MSKSARGRWFCYGKPPQRLIRLLSPRSQGVFAAFSVSDTGYQEEVSEHVHRMEEEPTYTGDDFEAISIAGALFCKLLASAVIFAPFSDQ